jgi:hypothetical protein
MTNPLSPVSTSGSITASSVTASDNLPYASSHIRNSSSEDMTLSTEHSTISIDEFARIAIDEQKATFKNRKSVEVTSPIQDRPLDDGRHELVS